jgi:hypothetical protein
MDISQEEIRRAGLSESGMNDLVEKIQYMLIHRYFKVHMARGGDGASFICPACGELTIYSHQLPPGVQHDCMCLSKACI